MAFKQDSVRGEWKETTRYVNDSEINVEILCRILKESFDEKGIKASLSIDEFVSGSMFSKTRTPLLLINHPDPTCKYFTLGIYANQNILNFPLFGESAENTKNNKYEYYKTQGTGLKANFYKPDMIKLQQEQLWQETIRECIDGL